MRNFVIGFVAANSIERLAWAWALSDSDTGRQVLKGVLAKIDHDKLLRVQHQINLELVRRRRQP